MPKTVVPRAKPVRTTKSREDATRIPEPRPYDGPPTNHELVLGDARHLEWIPDNSLHLVLTSPPYFNLKKYNDHPDQLGDWQDYEAFHDELDTVWSECYRTLVPGGRLVCNVGDVCVARRKNNGRHHVFPLHADIAVRCRRIGFDYLTPILWNKITNVNFEAGGGGFLGKPYEPNAILKNDVEYVLMLRKPGAYRKPTDDQRAQSRLTKEEQSDWFRPIWKGLTGASTKNHPAPFPEEFAYRLVRMFSFVGDVVLDPFGGTGTTTAACIRADRNSICNELDADYYEQMVRRVKSVASQRTLHQETPLVSLRDTSRAR